MQIFNGAISKKPLMQKEWLTKYIPESGIPKDWFEINTFSYHFYYILIKLFQNSILVYQNKIEF